MSFIIAPNTAARLKIQLRSLVEPGGRLLVSHYQDGSDTDRTVEVHLRALGFQVAGSARARDTDRGATTAWQQA